MNDELDVLIAATLKIPQSQIRDDLEYGSIEQWNSLSHVNLMLKLEMKYDFEIDEDTMVELTSIRAIKHFISEKA